MNNKYILALDQGTGSCRAFLIDQDQHIVSKAQKEYRQIYPEATWVEHDPIEILETQMSVIENCLDGFDISFVKGIAITNQRETSVVWEKKSGKPVYNAIVWQDKRTRDQCVKIKEKYGELIQSKSGLVVDTYFSATKIKWILDSNEELKEQAKQGDLCAGTIDAWLIWNLTEGESFVTESTNASRTMLYNILTGEWDKELLQIFDIPERVLPEVLSSDGNFGAANILDHKVPIVSVLGDQQSALFGQMCFDQGSCKCTIGTGAFVLGNIGNTFINAPDGLLTTIAWEIDGQKTYAFEGSVFSAGSVVKWLKESLNIDFNIESSSDLAYQSNDHEVFFVTAFNGLGAPYWNMETRAEITGLSLGSSKADILRAALDSIAFRISEVIELMESESSTISHIMMDGGASENDYLLQFLSNISQKVAKRPHEIEATILGVSYLAGIQLDFWKKSQILPLDSQVFKPEINGEMSESKKDKWKLAISKALHK